MEENKMEGGKDAEMHDNKDATSGSKPASRADAHKKDEESKGSHGAQLHVSTKKNTDHFEERDNLDNEENNKSWHEYRVTGRAPRRRSYHASFVYENYYYIHGGFDIREGTFEKLYKINLDPKTAENNWEEITQRGLEKPGKIAYHKLIRYENKAYLVGGSNLEKDNEKMFEFDTTTNEWKWIKPHGGVKLSPRDEHSANLWNDIIVVFGGNVNGWKSNDLWFYYIKENKWEEIKTTDAPLERSNHWASVYGDSLYIFGGKDTERNKLNDLWQLNLSTKTWKKIEQKGDIPIERSGATLITYKDYLVMFGGIYELTKELGDWYAFDIKSNSWYTLFEEFDSPTHKGSPGAYGQTKKLDRADSIRSPSPMHKNSNSFQAENPNNFSMNLKKTKGKKAIHTSIFEVIPYSTYVLIWTLKLRFLFSR